MQTMNVLISLAAMGIQAGVEGTQIIAPRVFACESWEDPGDKMTLVDHSQFQLRC